MSKRVFVAMSGGVDSSVSAYLLKEAGYLVSGIHLELTDSIRGQPVGPKSDLEHTCRMLNIPVHFVNAETEFKEMVIDYFCEEYNLGHTPNPCIQCNKTMKFGLLLDKVREMGGDFLATGHYARVEPSADGYRLLKGADSSKDQSYFLYVLGQEELSRVLFPIGELTKAEVKIIAADLGLPAAVRQESQDTCFIPDGNHQAFLAARLNSPPGEIVDTEGNIRGQHRGLAYYTVGQRQGIGVSASERLYVIRLDPASNRLVLGTQEMLFKKRLIAYNLHWISGRAPEGYIDVMAKVRYRTPEVHAFLLVKDDRAEVKFFEPQRAIAPGQSVVFFEGDSVLGGGIIAATEE